MSLILLLVKTNPSISVVLGWGETFPRNHQGQVRGLGIPLCHLMFSQWCANVPQWDEKLFTSHGQKAGLEHPWWVWKTNFEPIQGGEKRTQVNHWILLEGILHWIHLVFSDLFAIFTQCLFYPNCTGLGCSSPHTTSNDHFPKDLGGSLPEISCHKAGSWMPLPWPAGFSIPAWFQETSATEVLHYPLHSAIGRDSINAKYPDYWACSFSSWLSWFSQHFPPQWSNGLLLKSMNSVFPV